MKAVVFIDVQNDFVKGGTLAFGYPTEDNVPKIKAFAKECREKGYVLFATADTHNPSYKDLGNGLRETLPGGYMSTLEGKRLPIEHCISGTYGHQIVDGLVKDECRNVIIPQGNIIDKNTFGSLDLPWKIDSIVELSGEPLDEIVICGYCTSICVMANAVILRAKFPNTKITVRADLCGDINEDVHNAALKVLKMQQIDVENS